MEFDAQRLGKTVHVSLRRGVDGEGGQGNQAGGRADVANPTRLFREHAWKRPAGEPCQGDNIDREHRFDSGRLAGFKGAEVAEPGVIDEDVRRKSPAFQVGKQACNADFAGEIRRDGLDLDRGMLRENAVFDFFQPIRTPGRDNQMGCASCGKLFGKFLAEPG